MSVADDRPEQVLEDWQCGFYGHKTKMGKPCRYRIKPGLQCCPHHDPDPERWEGIQRKADAGKITRTIPDQIEITDLATSQDIQFGFQQVIKAASTQKSIDLKRLDVVIRALNGANAVQQTEEIREQNRILMMLDGHGASIAALQRLKDAPVKALPGRKPKTLVGGPKASQPVEATPQPSASAQAECSETVTSTEVPPCLPE